MIATTAFDEQPDFRVCAGGGSYNCESNEAGSALGGVRVSKSVGPFAEGGLDEAFGLGDSLFQRTYPISLLGLGWLIDRFGKTGYAVSILPPL